MSVMAKQTPAQRTEIEEVRRAVAAFVAAGADESVQRVVTAVHRLSRRLDQWYDRQLADIDVSTGEWAVLGELARSGEDTPLTPSQLAAAANVAPSSMTHRLDRMVQRGLIERAPDPNNRTRVLVKLSDAGYALYAAAIRESDLVESDLLESLSDAEVDQLAELLEKVISGLDAGRDL
jgi:DNA-binding MarR family transcriptional regulator